MHSFLQGRLIFVRLILLAATLMLVATGVITIYAVGNPAETGTTYHSQHLRVDWQKQIQYAGVGILGFFIINLFDYRKLGTISFLIYAFVLLLLAVLLLDKFIDLSFVPMRNGTRRWIHFKIAGRSLPAIQPSEFCKLAYILALAWYLRYRSNYRKFTSLIGPFLLTLLPMVLILLEPDLGTVLLMMPILFAMLFSAGAKVKHLLLIVLMGVVVSPFLWTVIRPYQRERISSVLLQFQWLRQKTEQNSKLANILVGKKFSEKRWKAGSGYQLIRSKYAIASGGLKGFGFCKGPFIKYDFLPYKQNDFIFAVIAHQWGFWGCLAVLALYSIIILCGLEIIAHNTDPFGKLLVAGIIVMFAVEFIVNVSMTIGLMPITGLTLPFVSYGGSSLTVSMMAVGLMNNVGRHRPFSVSRKAHFTNHVS